MLDTEDPDGLDMWPNYDTVRAPDREVKLRVRISQVGDDGGSSGRGDGGARPSRGDDGASSGRGELGSGACRPRGRKRARSPETPLIDVTHTAMKADYFVLLASGREPSAVQWLRSSALDSRGQPINTVST